MDERANKSPSRKDASQRAKASSLDSWVVWSGHFMAGFLICSFIALFINSVVQLDFWQTYFFAGTINAGENCTVVARFADAPEEQLTGLQEYKISIPHVAKESRLPKVASGNGEAGYIRARYSCKVSTAELHATAEAVYLHMGWVRAETTRIKVNGQLRTSFKGMDKPVVPLLAEELLSPEVNVEVDIYAKNSERAGLAYASPMVVSHNSTTNFRVLGIDYALATQKSLYRVLPLLTLGVILAFGWFIGIRATALIVTFLYFSLSTLQSSLWLFNHWWPWPFSVTRDLSNLLVIANLYAFVIFALEMFGFFRARIFHLSVVLAGLVGLAGGAILYFEPEFATLNLVRAMLRTILLAALGAVFYFGYRRIKHMRRSSRRERAEKLMLCVVMTLIVLVVFATVGDWIATAASLWPIRLSPYLYRFLPLFVGGVVLYSLYLVEQKMQEEQNRRVKMEGELNLAAKLQNVLLPDSLEGEILGYSYKIESIPHGILGGDWVKVHAGEGRAIMILGDVVGKGASAALTHSGIAASWESQIKLWDKGTASSDYLLTRINETMFDLFSGEMNTTFAAVELLQDGRARVAAGGNYWLHLSPEHSRPLLSAGRSLLGVKAEFSIKFQDIEMQRGDWLVCFTDGVLEGNRPIKRFMRSIQPHIASMSAGQLRDALVTAGAGEVQPDDASILVLKYGPMGVSPT